MITILALDQEAEAFAMPDPKHITLGLREITVRTGADMPAEPLTASEFE